jgi:hypothetical protein
MESSIRLVPRPSSMRGRISRTIGLFSITALVGVGAMFAWHSHGDEAGEMVKLWTSSVGWISSVSTKSPPAPAVATTSSEIAQRPQPAAPDAATHMTAQSSPLPSKNRRAPILQRRRTSDRKRYRRLRILGRNALLCQRRDRQPLRAGCLDLGEGLFSIQRSVRPENSRLDARFFIAPT